MGGLVTGGVPMNKQTGIILFAALMLTGCQTVSAPEDPTLWGRFDCMRMADGPEIQAEFEQAKLICSGRSEAAAIAGTAAMPNRGRGLSGAIVSGIEQGITGAQISVATAKSCMAERGLFLAKKSEHLARCPTSVVVADARPALRKPAAVKPVPEPPLPWEQPLQ